jgi:hypothetical protein
VLCATPGDEQADRDGGLSQQCPTEVSGHASIFRFDARER